MSDLGPQVFHSEEGNAANSHQPHPPTLPKLRLPLHLASRKTSQPATAIPTLQASHDAGEERFGFGSCSGDIDFLTHRVSGRATGRSESISAALQALATHRRSHSSRVQRSHERGGVQFSKHGIQRTQQQYDTLKHSESARAHSPPDVVIIPSAERAALLSRDRGEQRLAQIAPENFEDMQALEMLDEQELVVPTNRILTGRMRYLFKKQRFAVDDMHGRFLKANMMQDESSKATKKEFRRPSHLDPMHASMKMMMLDVSAPAYRKSNVSGTSNARREIISRMRAVIDEGVISAMADLPNARISSYQKSLRAPKSPVRPRKDPVEMRMKAQERQSNAKQRRQIQMQDQNRRAAKKLAEKMQRRDTEAREHVRRCQQILVCVVMANRCCRLQDALVIHRSALQQKIRQLKAARIIQKKARAWLKRARRVVLADKLLIAGKVIVQFIRMTRIQRQIATKRKASYTIRIFIRESASQNSLKRAVMRFRYKVVKLQRWIKKTLRIHRARIKSLMNFMRRNEVGAMNALDLAENQAQNPDYQPPVPAALIKRKSSVIIRRTSSSSPVNLSPGSRKNSMATLPNGSRSPHPKPPKASAKQKRLSFEEAVGPRGVWVAWTIVPQDKRVDVCSAVIKLIIRLHKQQLQEYSRQVHLWHQWRDQKSMWSGVLGQLIPKNSKGNSLLNLVEDREFPSRPQLVIVSEDTESMALLFERAIGSIYPQATRSSKAHIQSLKNQLQDSKSAAL